MLENPSLQLSWEVVRIGSCQSLPCRFFNLGTTMKISKRDAVPTAETIYMQLSNGWNLVTTNREVDFRDFTMDDRETVTLVGYCFHLAPSKEFD